MTYLPQETLDAATKAAMDGVLSQHGLKLTEEQVWPIVWIALTDAAPHIAAAERERIRQLADKHHATAAVDCRCTDPSTHEPDAGHYVRFADLLAEDG